MAKPSQLTTFDGGAPPPISKARAQCRIDLAKFTIISDPFLFPKEQPA